MDATEVPHGCHKEATGRPQGGPGRPQGGHREKRVKVHIHRVVTVTGIVKISILIKTS